MHSNITMATSVKPQWIQTDVKYQSKVWTHLSDSIERESVSKLLTGNIQVR